MTGIKDISREFHVVRGLAVCGIIIENWLSLVPRAFPTSAVGRGVDILQAVAGTMVHLFFVLSGYGLMLSYLKAESFAWSEWAGKRFVRVVFPYLVTVAATFALVDMLHRFAPDIFGTSHSWTTLFAYSAFLRNFHSLDSSFNPTLWFMPVIIGLYLLFPLLVWLLRKKGVLFLLLFSAGLTYLSITLCLLAGYYVSHDTALPFFFVIEFALGMALGFLATGKNARPVNLATSKAFGVGMIFYALSWVLRSIWAFGNAYNDLLTAMGILLLTLYPCHLLLRISGERLLSGLGRLSKQSYLMYLLHGTLILFVAKPLLQKAGMLPLNALTSAACAVSYCVSMLLLATVVSRSLDYLSALLFPAVSRKE